MVVICGSIAFFTTTGIYFRSGFCLFLGLCLSLVSFLRLLGGSGIQFVVFVVNLRLLKCDDEVFLFPLGRKFPVFALGLEVFLVNLVPSRTLNFVSVSPLNSVNSGCS